MKQSVLDYHLIGFALLLTTLGTTGCIHCRVMCAANVEDVGPVVETKYRYCFADEKLRNSGDFIKLKKTYPKVFSEDGIPFSVKSGGLGSGKVRKSYVWTVACPYACSLLTLPMFNTSEWDMDYVVDLVDIPDAHAEFSSCFRYDHAFAMWTPSPLLFYVGKFGNLGDSEKYNNCRVFHSRNVQIMGGLDVVGESQGDSLKSCVCNPFMNEAYAYGLVVTLKKMEDAGLVDLWKDQSRNLTNESSLRIGKDLELLNFGREQGSDFSYRFKIVNRKGDMSLREAREVRKLLVKTVREDYLCSNPYAAPSMLVVDFPIYDLKGSEVAGRAVVLRIDVRSLNYEPNTRRGIMRIRLDEGQFTEARNYVRRNIEFIVRDKGVALEGGKIPDAATFRLLDEKLSDGVLEVNFKAE